MTLMMASLRRYFKLKHMIIQNILVLQFAALVWPGANDLHFHDGASTADIIAGDVFFEIIDPPELMYTYRIRPAKDFGSSFNESFRFRKAHLVPTVPIDSCTEIKNRKKVLGHIALLRRGDCSFVHKTMNAQLAGAQAVIITDAFESWQNENLIEMVDDRTNLDVNIPAGFLPGRSGLNILVTLRRLDKQYAVINLPVNMTHTAISKMNQPPWTLW